MRIQSALHKPSDCFGFFEDDMHSLLNREFWMDRYLHDLDRNCVSYKTEEQANYYRMSMDVPGVSPKHIQLKVKDSVLEISTRKKKQEDEKEKHNQRHFRATFTLPSDVSVDQMEANIENGVMEIVIPKNQSVTEKVIPVQVGSGQGFWEKIKKQFH